MNEKTIGFIGLGNMGQPMALNLLKAGYTLKVYNRTADKIAPLVAQGARSASRPGEAVTTGSILVSIVTDDAALEAIVMSEGLLERLGQDGVHLSMSTVSPTTSQRLAAMHIHYGSYYIDAPVFGVPQVAAEQKLWICQSGPAVAKERVRPLLEAMGQGIFDFGEEVGAANIVKLSGNFISFAAAQAMIEVLTLAQKNGIDPTNLVDMLTQTLFPIAIYQHAGKQIALDPEHFAMRRSWIALKDVGLFNEATIQAESQAPLAHLLHDLLATK